VAGTVNSLSADEVGVMLAGGGKLSLSAGGGAQEHAGGVGTLLANEVIVLTGGGA
jgi:hypothetical protein